MTMTPRARRTSDSAAIETEGRLSAMEVQIDHLIAGQNALSEKVDKQGHDLSEKIDHLADIVQKSEESREFRASNTRERVAHLENKIEGIISKDTQPAPDELTIIFRKVVVYVYIALAAVFVMFVLTIFEHLSGIDIKKFLG